MIGALTARSVSLPLSSFAAGPDKARHFVQCCDQRNASPRAVGLCLGCATAPAIPHRATGRLQCRPRDRRHVAASGTHPGLPSTELAPERKAAPRSPNVRNPVTIPSRPLSASARDRAACASLPPSAVAWTARNERTMHRRHRCVPPPANPLCHDVDEARDDSILLPHWRPLFFGQRVIVLWAGGQLPRNDSVGEEIRRLHMADRVHSALGHLLEQGHLRCKPKAIYRLIKAPKLEQEALKP